MKAILSALFFVCFFAPNALGQSTLPFSKFWIGFRDKENTPYNINQPEQFLSAKAIERRVQQGIAIQQNDLPVTPDYVEQVRNAGAEVLYTSKWFNGVVIRTEDSTILLAVQQLPFVNGSHVVSKTSRPKPFAKPAVPALREAEEVEEDSLYYGTAYHQIQMLNGDLMHAAGFKGEGMTVAILDAGFIAADQNPVFANHYAEGRILGTRDFVDGDDDVYGYSTHGSNVFSIMGGDQPDFYVGGAPKASYWLIRTEDGATETRIEEYNWAAGAEFADSVGVDVINSSLGYSLFDYTEMNYTYGNMNGDDAIVTQAADLAASKGILVVASAGNSGGKEWRYITAPADADSILTVGAIDAEGNYAYFSSQGPTNDNRVKPNVVAQGQMTEYVNIGGEQDAGNGTSYSSPLMAGLVTCLWQANKSKKNMDIIRAVEQSASQYANPDGYLGYGIPNFGSALELVTGLPITLLTNNTTQAFAYPNPINDDINIYYYAQQNETLTIHLRDLTGRTIATQTHQTQQNAPYRFTFAGQDLPKGLYLIRINNEKGQKTIKVLKTNQ